MRRADLIIVVLDISGYTGFTRAHGLASLHAEGIVSDLLETVIDATGAPLVVNKLEGDAVLAYAEATAGPAAIGQIPRVMRAFRAKRDELIFCRACFCDACRAMGDLRLKAIVHRGPTVIKSVGGFEEIGGESVIVAHRLLKNSVEAEEYLLLTADARREAAPPAGFGEERRTEKVADFGSVETFVLRPGPDAAPPPVRVSWARARLRGLAHAWRLDVYAVKRLLGGAKARPRR